MYTESINKMNLGRQRIARAVNTHNISFLMPRSDPEFMPTAKADQPRN